MQKLHEQNINILNKGRNPWQWLFQALLRKRRPKSKILRICINYNSYFENMKNYILPSFQTEILLNSSLHACSVLSDSATPWTVTQQAPLSMGFPRQEYWSGFPLPPQGNHPNPGTEPLAGRFFTIVPPGKPMKYHLRHVQMAITKR